MTIIYNIENNCNRYGATFQNNGYVKVQKLEEISDDKKIYTNSILWKHFWVKVNYVI